MGFPWNKPSRYWGTPMAMETAGIMAAPGIRSTISASLATSRWQRNDFPSLSLTWAFEVGTSVIGKSEVGIS